MKLNKIFLTAAMALSGVCASAQTADEEVVYTFKPHWYVQGQVGLQETLGEASFGDLASFNAQLVGGYNFNSVLGARLSLNSFNSKGVMKYADAKYKWKWTYIAPSVDLTVDLINLMMGYNPKRLFTGGVFAGIGANIAWKNDEARDVNSQLKAVCYPDMEAGMRPDALRNLWDGTKTRLQGRMGVFADARVSDRVKIGIELQANVLNDHYNSKKAGNADWYFNGLVGVKYSFGSGYKKSTRKKCSHEPKVVERVVQVPVEKEVVKEVVKEIPAAMTRNVFFKISRTVVTPDQMNNVADIAAYLREFPKSKVTVTGYADKGTGSMTLNKKLALQRAQAVADALIQKFGVSADRIVVKSMDDNAEQPYAQPELNRVSICVAK